MDTKYFSLSRNDSSRIEKTLRILFGMVCIAIAVFWFVFNIRSLKVDTNLWLTILFLSAYGSYQMWTGMGRAICYIKIAPDHIVLRKSSVLPSRKLNREGIGRIELFPMSIIFFAGNGKKIYLRFGTAFTNNIEPIKEAITRFAADNNIQLEIKNGNTELL